jgi:hypothetical protein
LLATPTVPVYDYSHAEPSLSAYTSMMLKLYFQNLAKFSVAEVLDVGPVCNENIVHFAQRVKRVYVCDLFLRWSRNRSKGLVFEKVLEHLDYAPGSFDGINLWDLIDHLKDDDISRLVKRCHALLVPGGMMNITSFEKQWAPAKTYSFVIKDRYQVAFRLQHHLDLPRYFHSNRIMTSVLSKFRTVKSFIYRNGVREFLCRND